MPLMSTGTFEDGFFEFDRFMSIGLDEDNPTHASGAFSLTNNGLSIFDSRPAPELFEKYTEEDFASAIPNYLRQQ